MMRNPVKFVVNILIYSVLTAFIAAPASLPAKAEETAKPPVAQESTIPYLEYQKRSRSKPYEGGDLVIPAIRYSDASHTPEIKTGFAGAGGESLLTGEDGFVEWTFEAPEDAWYQCKVEYYPVKGKNASIERELRIDGTLPFNEARSILFSRAWADGLSEKGRIEQDRNGNDIRPSQIEKPRWMTVLIQDAAGYAAQGLTFYLSAGSHTLRLISVREPMLLKSIRICAPRDAPSYSEYRGARGGAAPPQQEPIILEAEKTALKSDPTLIPVFDRSTPNVRPNDPVKLKLNCIGGGKWQTAGQWLEYEFEVKSAGDYQIAFHAIQNTLNGAYSSRKIYIDGQILFHEMQSVRFSYSTRWKMHRLGTGEEPYLFYFGEGKHTLRLEATLADMALVIEEVEDITRGLNSVYRNILVLTGPNPDVNRDYQFEKVLPDELESMALQAVRLNAAFERITEQAGMKGENAQIMRKLSRQLAEIVEKPDTLSKRFSSFQANISALGTWILTAQQQPLTLDAIYIVPAGQAIPQTKASFFESVAFHVRSFLSSFTNDYNLLAGEESERGIRVWVGSGLTGGRDQAQILKTMSENHFTPQRQISVDLQLVQMGALLPATLSGNGPDAALSIGASDALNYAIRNAVVSLTQFSDYAEVSARFSPSALTPVSFKGGVYGLPETQTYPMLFYRKDILSDLELAVPDTWDDVIRLLKVLQKKQMNFGLPSTVNIGNGAVYPTFGMLLYQNGGSFYSPGGEISRIDSKEAADAFSFLTTLYSDYKLPLALDFINRFRTGAIPIGIADYSLYNQLSVFAPELNGLWDFALVPGIRQADGSIDRTACGAVNVAVILGQTTVRREAWEFLKWWTSTDSQVRFGHELESIMGTAARYPTANMEALYQIPWSKASFEVLMEQWKWVRGIPEVPGGYFTARYVDFAFRNVVYDAKDSGEELMTAAESINAEIKTKRKEFGLSD